MLKTKPSLYSTLGFIVVLTSIVVMSLFAAGDYRATKNAFIKVMEDESRSTALVLADNVGEAITAYAVYDYEQLIQTELRHNNNLAIIIEDFKMGEILDEGSFLSGSIRDADWNVVDYNPENREQNRRLKGAYYSEKHDVNSRTGEKLGTISVYTSDHFLNSALDKIVWETLLEAFVMAILLILILIVVIKQFVLKPISDIIDVITESDADGVPLKQLPENDSSEIFALTQSMNTMISSIQDSRVELYKQHKKLKLSSRVFRESHEGIMITDPNRKITDVNPAFSEITGYSNEESIGKTPQMLSSGKHSPEFFQEIWLQVEIQERWQGEVWNRKKDGEIYAELLSISVMKDDDGKLTNYLGVFTDITQSKKQQERLSLMAHYDVLTGLPNRVLFADRFQQAVVHSHRTGNQLAVCFLDLDDFKPVNDQYGHEAGDKLLVEVANRITANIREEDTVSRQGGDEFTLLLNDIDSYEHCERTLERIHQALAEPYIIDEYSHEITASSGVTLYPSDKGDIDTLLRHADQAMYKAKLDGKHCYHLFNPENDLHTIEKRKQLNNIEEALSNDEFSLYYQPKVNMVTGEVFGAEALIRWTHPEKGLIPPLDFLPLIEESELDIKVGEWVINQAVEQLDTWQKQGLDLELSINISSYHLLSTSFLSQLEFAIDSYPKIAPQKLQLEILESSALGDLNLVNNVIKACQATLGVTVALDDFGTGYSSLTHLRSLTVEVIKIDRSFVRDILDDASDYAIVEGTIGLAGAFDRDLIAEGVETTGHGLMLLLMGCEKAQGYGIARPMPIDDFILWINSYKANQAWMMAGKTSYSKSGARIALFRLITSRWGEKFTANILSDPENVESWPIMDGNHCPCGIWLKRDRSERLFKEEQLNQLDQAHISLHQLANTLLIKYQEGDLDSARAGLPELETIVYEMDSILAQCN